MAEKREVIPIHALFDGSGINPNLDSDPRPAFRDAQIIIGVDVMSQREFLVFGRELLQEIVTSGRDQSVATLYIGLDQETDELEQLIALTVATKGRHDCEPLRGPYPEGSPNAFERRDSQ